MKSLNRVISNEVFSSFVFFAFCLFEGVAAFGQNSAADSSMIKRIEDMQANHLYLLVSGSRILWTQKGVVKDFSKTEFFIDGKPTDFKAFKALKDKRLWDCYVCDDTKNKSIIVHTMGHGSKEYLNGELQIKRISPEMLKNVDLHKVGVDANGEQIACLFTKGFQGDADKIFADLIGPGGREGFGGESAYLLFPDDFSLEEYDFIVNGKPVSRSDFAKMKTKKMKSLVIKWPPVDLSKIMIR